MRSQITHHRAFSILCNHQLTNLTTASDLNGRFWAEEHLFGQGKYTQGNLAATVQPAWRLSLLEDVSLSHSAAQYT